MTASHDWAVELSHTWPLLGDTGRASISSTALAVGSTAGAVRIGVDGGAGRHLLVPVGQEDVHGDDSDGVLTVLVKEYTFQRTTLRYVDVACARPDLASAFDNVLVDILGQLEETDTPAGTTVEAVKRWRALLATRRGSKLTLTQQMSLFAELFVLDLVSDGTRIDPHCWRGPRREPHDIVLPAAALEVKAVGKSSQSITIHGVDQLEPPGKPLALVLVEVLEDEQGQTLSELVEEFLSRATDRGEALWLLATAGFERLEAERYQERFAVGALSHLAVSRDTPRVVASSFEGGSVPEGVTRLQYHIGLDQIGPRLTRGQTALSAWVASA
ncbi:PD-(D/E)XK motif protein [Kineococcus sp. SYSU DK003]|uniref:PD-(D/E)XK motif protein n=1 Tax=Kineococcus sp. SYSU DK003 TaxID=3383124 RepID=UPI003D7E4603